MSGVAASMRKAGPAALGHAFGCAVLVAAGVFILSGGSARLHAETPATMRASYTEPFWVHRAEAHGTGAVRHAAGASMKAGAGAPVKVVPQQTGMLRDAGDLLPGLAGTSPGGKGAAANSTPWAIVLGLTLLTLLPALLLAMTPMVRLLVVFHFLRQALGTQTAPSNQVLMGLALMMTWFLMQPVLLQVERDAVTPYRQGTIDAGEAVERGSAPVKSYMLRYAREKDLAVFVNASGAPRPASKADLPMPVVVPAYMLSELKAGFGIGAVLFLPFLLIDFLVASVTTSIGMLQLSPAVIATPVKILLFVMVDGWSLLAGQLLRSF